MAAADEDLAPLRAELARAYQAGDGAAMVAVAAQAWAAGARDRTVAAALVVHGGEDHPLYPAAHDVVVAHTALAGAAIESVAAAAARLGAAPADRLAWAQLVRGLLAIGELRRAIDGLAAAVADRVLGGEAWLILAIELCQGEHVAEARAVVDRLAAAAPVPDLAALAALLRLADGDAAGADEALARAEALNPGAALVWVAAHAIALARGDSERATRAARRAEALGVAPAALGLLHWSPVPTA